MHVDPKYEDVFPCKGIKNKGCSCLENYIRKKISTSNNEFENEVDVLDFVLRLRKKASKLSKEKCTTPTSQDNGTDNRNARSKGSRKKKSKRYMEFIIEKREILKEDGVCEVSCKNILKYSNNLVHRLLKNDPENRNSIITGAKSKTSRRKPKISFDSLIATQCCHHFCNTLIGECPQYYSNLRAEAQKCNKNKRSAIKELIFFSLTQRKLCNKFIIQALGISRGTLKTVKQELGITGKSRKSTTTNVSEPITTPTTRAPPRESVKQNQTPLLQLIQGTINNSHVRTNDRMTSKRVNDNQVTRKNRFQHIDRAFDIQANVNQNDEKFSNQYSNYQPMANRNIQPQQILTQQCVIQQIPTQQLVSQQIPTQKCWNQQIPTQQCVSQQIPTQKRMSQQIPTQQLVSQQIPTQQCSNQQIPIQQCVSQQIPAQQRGNQQIPTQQYVSQQILTQKCLSQQIPTQQCVSQQIPTQQCVSQQIPTQQCVVQQIENPEFVNNWVYPVEYPNSLQQHVQIPCNGYTNQTIQPNQVSVNASPQISYQNVPVIHTNVYEQQSVDTNQSDDLYILIKKDDHYELLPVASWQRIIFDASLNANYQICHPELLERFLTNNGYSLLDNQLAALRQISESYQHSQSQS